MVSDGRKPEPETGISKVHFKLERLRKSKISTTRTKCVFQFCAAANPVCKYCLWNPAEPAEVAASFGSCPGVNVDGDSSPDSSSAPVLTENRACSRREDAGERSSVRQRIKRIGVSDGWE